MDERFRKVLAEGLQRAQLVDGRHRLLDGHRCVHLQRAWARSLPHLRAHGLLERLDERGHVRGLDRATSRRGVTAVLHQQRGACIKARMQVDAGRCATRRLQPRVLAAEQHHRPVELLHQPRGGQAQQARMPRWIRHHDGRPARVIKTALHDQHLGCANQLILAQLALVVGDLQLARRGSRLGRIVGVEYAQRVGGFVQATRGVQPRPDVKAERARIHLGGAHACLAKNGLHARNAAGRQTLHRLGHQHAVLVEQRHHVGHQTHRGQRQRDVHHPVAKSLGRSLAAAQADQSLGHLEGHHAARDVLEWTPAKRWMRHRLGLRHHRRAIGATLHAVMVCDHHAKPQLLRQRRLLETADAAVDRDHRLHPFGLQLPQRVGVHAVALVHAVRNEHARRGIEQPQQTRHDRGRAQPIGVVVTVDRDAQALLQPVIQGGGRGIGARQRRRFAQQ